jgi:hypothetical protein
LTNFALEVCTTRQDNAQMADANCPQHVIHLMNHGDIS